MGEVIKFPGPHREQAPEIERQKILDLVDQYLKQHSLNREYIVEDLVHDGLRITLNPDQPDDIDNQSLHIAIVYFLRDYLDGYTIQHWVKPTENENEPERFIEITKS